MNIPYQSYLIYPVFNLFPTSTSSLFISTTTYCKVFDLSYIMYNDPWIWNIFYSILIPDYILKCFPYTSLCVTWLKKGKESCVFVSYMQKTCVLGVHSKSMSSLQWVYVNITSVVPWNWKGFRQLMSLKYKKFSVLTAWNFGVTSDLYVWQNFPEYVTYGIDFTLKLFLIF
jgi:hypothetical protein